VVKAAIDLSEEAVQYRQRIQQHMRCLGGQRKLVAKLELEGKAPRPARQDLRVMLFGHEALLAEHQRAHGKKS
jgi:hypothetical protein